MENQKKPIYKDLIFQTGILLILLSAGIFSMPDFFLSLAEPDSFFGYFFFNYGIAITYLVILFIQGIIRFRLSVDKKNLEYALLLMVLFMISAFSLNREIPVFEESTTWLTSYLVIQSIALILVCLRSYLNRWINLVLYFFLGAGLPLFIYYTIFLFPIYHLGFLGAIFFGISLHIFLPLLFTIFLIVVLVRASLESRYYLSASILGILFPLLTTAIFINKWSDLKKKINATVNTQIANDTDLPAWVEVSRILPDSWIAERLMKAGLVYRSTDGTDNFFRWGLSNRSFDDVKKHDPLVMMAGLLNGQPEISEEEKINVLESKFDARHQAQDRLWNGKDLSTSNVITNVKLYPEYRLAYTEKILSIHNSSRDTWRSQQEAIYTFHLPEGSVVTSLSLWIAGKEEKGILTTKSKADTAYKTIVGVEARDPSVIHWQEGNTVTVRVFPCTRDENRRFKIGITSPLKYENKELVYRNVYFNGPKWNDATETIQVQFNKTAENLNLPFGAEKLNGKYVFNGSYNSYWEARLAAPKLLTDTFTFGGSSYYVTELSQSRSPFDAQTIFLDLNSSWTKVEYDKVWKTVAGKNVYVPADSPVKLTEENRQQVFEEYSNVAFSLFPFFLVKDPATTLVITKNPSLSPNLSDLKGSRFSEHLTNYMRSGNKVNVFSLGDTLSPYLKTLKELRLISLNQGALENLAAILLKKEFSSSLETDSIIPFDQAGIVINKIPGTIKGNAPDHLLRLFNYNMIMQKTGKHYFDPEKDNAASVELASQAYCVSPVSSLIVLETKQDYERFGIDENKNSLKNASMKSSGAVPEPHEWCLIILSAFVASWLYYKRRIQKSTAC